MSDLTHLFHVDQNVRCSMDCKMYDGIVVCTYPNHIIVDIPGISDHCWFDDDNLDFVYPDYN